jgi:hypothetical protein
MASGQSVCGQVRGAMASGQNTRVRLTRGSVMASGQKIHAGVESDGSRAKACVGRPGAGAMNLRPYIADAQLAMGG